MAQSGEPPYPTFAAGNGEDARASIWVVEEALDEEDRSDA
jgi:hypothetical protein